MQVVDSIPSGYAKDSVTLDQTSRSVNIIKEAPYQVAQGEIKLNYQMSGYHAINVQFKIGNDVVGSVS